MQQAAKLILVAAGLLTLVSCSSALRVTSIPAGEPIVNPSDVAILRELPPSSYTEVAKIQLRWAGLREERDVRRDDKIARALRAEAARLGADAVIHLTLISEPGGQRPDRWYAEPPRLKGISATAIRLKRSANSSPD
jgi:hypothetical protein